MRNAIVSLGAFVFLIVLCTAGSTRAANEFLSFEPVSDWSWSYRMAAFDDLKNWWHTHGFYSAANANCDEQLLTRLGRQQCLAAKRVPLATIAGYPPIDLNAAAANGNLVTTWKVADFNQTQAEPTSDVFVGKLQLSPDADAYTEPSDPDDGVQFAPMWRETDRDHAPTAGVTLKHSF